MSIATTEEIENLPNRPEVLLIDVRDPPEIKSTGTIPTSINIPCKLTAVAYISLDNFAQVVIYSNATPL